MALLDCNMQTHNKLKCTLRWTENATQLCTNTQSLPTGLRLPGQPSMSQHLRQGRSSQCVQNTYMHAPGQAKHPLMCSK